MSLCSRFVVSLGLLVFTGIPSSLLVTLSFALRILVVKFCVLVADLCLFVVHLCVFLPDLFGLVVSLCVFVVVVLCRCVVDLCLCVPFVSFVVVLRLELFVSVSEDTLLIYLAHSFVYICVLFVPL